MEVRGAGRCGFYRVPDDDDTTEGEEKENQVVENGEETSEDKEKVDKKKNAEGTGEEGAEEDQAKEEEGEGTTEEKKKKKKRSFSYKAIDIKNINHSNPHHIIDIFPLALTYCSEPKASTYRRMKKYIDKYYPDVDDKKLKKALDKGVDLGIWELEKDNYTLNIQEFDPNLEDSIDDAICAAIIATTEPKIASAKLIKQYIQDYHPEFQVNTNLKPLKLAFESAIRRQLLQQTTGLGMTGSFELLTPFTPSPALLAGNEDMEEVETIIASDDYNENYVVRPTKSGRGKTFASRKQLSKPIEHHMRPPPTDRSKPAVKKVAKTEKKSSGIVKKVPKSKSKKGKRGRPKTHVSDDEENDNVEEDVSPSKKQKRVSDKGEDYEEDEEEEPPIIKQKKKSPKKGLAKKSPKKSPAKSPTKAKGRSKARVEDEEEAAEKVIDKSPPKKRGRNRSTPTTKAASTEKPARISRRKSLTSYKEVDESDTDKSDDDEPVAKKSKSRK